MNLLHIDASANLQGNSRALTRYFVNHLKADKVTVRDVAQQQLPIMDAETLMAFHVYSEGDAAPPRVRQHLTLSDTLIAELKAADVVVLGVPMYNFGLPLELKNWIDHVARQGLTFVYGKHGPEGLICDTSIYIVATSGGTPIGSPFDFASTHARQVFTFLGASRIEVVDASGSKGSPQSVIDSGKAQIDLLLSERVFTDAQSA